MTQFITPLPELAPIIVSDQWLVFPLTLTPEKVDHLWATVQRHPTLFSDHLRGNQAAWFARMIDPDIYWLEVQDMGGQVVGLISFEGISLGTEVFGHMAFFDRVLSEKTQIVTKILEHMFDSFPLQRISVIVPDVYRATRRMLEKLGFKYEGKRRASFLLGKKWVDEVMFGMLRSDIFPLEAQHG